MKRRRMMAMAMAVAMLSSSVSFPVYADEAAVDNTAADETASGAAVSSDNDGLGDAVAEEETAEPDETAVSAYGQPGYIGGLKTNLENHQDDEWKAAVFGDAGGQVKVGGFEWRKNAFDADGNQIPYYVAEKEDSGDVHLRMGIFNDDGSVQEATGKVSSSSDGIVYYYKDIDPGTNFELSGTIKVNNLDNTNNQVSFGAMVRDYVDEMTDPSVYDTYVDLLNQRAEINAAANAETDADKKKELQAQASELTKQANATFNYAGSDMNKHYVAVGPLFMANFGKSNNNTVKTFCRNDSGNIVANDSSASAYNPLFMYNGDSNISAGQKYKVVLKKQGDVYSLQFGDEDPVTVDDIKIGDDGKYYVGFYACRAADITISDIEYKETEEVESLNLISAPDKTTYIVSKTQAPLETAGLKAEVTYKDGRTEILDDSSLLCSSVDLTTQGKKTVTVNYGGKTADFDIDVDYNGVTEMKLVYNPFATEFLVGGKFNSVGLEIEASYKDGTSETLSASQYEILIDGKPIGSDNYYFTADQIGSHKVTAAYITTNSILSNDKSVEYDINVSASEFDSIVVKENPVKGTDLLPFDLNEEFDPAGLIVAGNFTVNGKTTQKVLDENEYTVTGYDETTEDGLNIFTKEGPHTMTVTFNNDPSKTATFTVNVVAKKAVQAVILTYPRQTYFVGEQFDTKGLTVGVSYNNGVTLPVEETGYELNIDTSGFDSSKANSSENLSSVKVSVMIDGEESSVILPIRIVENEERIWKATIMGASSLGVAEGDESSNVTVYDNDNNKSLFMTGDSGNLVYEPSVGLMKDGKMTNVSKVRVRSWGGAGKYATDHDGIAYYYTKVNAENNYTISADITVNGYIRDPQNADDKALIAKKKAEMQAVFDEKGIKDENGERYVINDLEAMDMVRSGQEAFGIMARDVIPLYLPTAEGGDDNNITTDAQAAKKDVYGQPMTIFEAYKQQEYRIEPLRDAELAPKKEALEKATDENEKKKIEAEIDEINAKYDAMYTVTKEDINIISFSSNVIVAGGATSSTYPTDPTTSSFKEKSVQNRITLSYRSGVVNTEGAGSKTKGGFKTTTSRLPEAGDKYNITLKRINYGFALTTTDLTEDKPTYGETQTVYSFDKREELEELLTTQDPKNVYVGFFACRFGDMDVENISFNETDANVDAVINDMEEDIYSPKISVKSDLYTTNTNYTLVLGASNPNGGLVTIKQNGKIIYEDEKVYKKNTNFPVTFDGDSQNEFEFIYTPSKIDLCYDYSKVVSRVVITCKGMDSAQKDIYVAPDGKVDNAGTKDSPIDLETAVGLLNPGQRIIMLDGVYTTRDTINIAKTASGYSSAKKYVVADEGAEPIIDLQKKNAGFIISADYWEFDGITVMNSGGNSKPFHIGGNHNVVKNCTFHDNGDCGLQISRTDSSDKFEDWPSNNLILNCESFNNCDPSKNNADGFAVKLTVGNNNLFRGCVSHHNLDDGWDLYTKLSTGKIGEVTVENCASYRQGFELLADGTDIDYNATSGGNGFKAGGESIAVNHYFKDCIAFNNKGNGYDSNSNPVGKLRNVIFYNNLYSNVALYSSKRSLFSYDLDGVISYRDEKGIPREEDGTVNKNLKADRVGSLTEYTQFNNAAVDLSTVDSNYFIWTNPTAASKNNQGDVVTADFFKSTAEGDSLNAYQRYDRDETGAFIYGDFLARSDAHPYTHKAEDLVTLPDTGKEGSNTDASTEATTSDNTEATTSKRSSGGGGGGGGGSSSSGGSSARLSSTSTTTVEDDTEETTKSISVVENTTEATTANSDNLFNDIADKPWAVEAINSLAEAGIINGVGNGKFAPNASCKRADFAIMLVNMLGIDGTATDNFDDVSADKYYYNHVGLAKEAGIVNGYGDGNFGPENFTTREELMVMVANAVSATGVDISYDVDESVLDNFNDAEDVADWAKPYVAFLVQSGVVNGSNGNINPKNEITRAEVAVIMYNVNNLL